MKKKDEQELENMDLDEIKPSGDPIKDALIKSRSVLHTDLPPNVLVANIYWCDRLMERHAKLQKHQDRRLQRKNAAIVKEGGRPITLDRATKPDTTVSRR